MTGAARELDLTTATGRFAAMAWPDPGAPRVLCLHGWLDNAASFVPLAPHLPGLDLVALDLAGHGHSAHRSPGSRYYFMDNLWDIDAVLDALDWPACHLMGHSMGGALACVFAAAAPERVQSLVLLDGLGPVSAPAAETVERLRRSRQSVRNATGRLREFPDVTAAVEARRMVSELSETAARLICERSLEVYKDHYRWRTDPGLNWHSPNLLIEEQVLGILEAIEAPALSITARPLARWVNPEAAQRRLECMRDCYNHSIEGHHHFHMEVPATIAPLILEFLTAKETSDVPSQARHTGR